MDIILIIAGTILIITGIVGCFLPVIPGPPLAYLSLIILQFSSYDPFSTTLLVVYLVLTVIVTGLDYIIPVIGVKYSGGTRYGTVGSVLGLIVGVIIFPVVGIFIGPFAGALIGELIGGKNFSQALKAGIGSFLGFLAGTFIKLILCLFITYHFISVFI